MLIRCSDYGLELHKAGCYAFVYLFYAGGYASVRELIDWVRMVYAVEKYFGRRSKAKNSSIARMVRRGLSRLKDMGIVERERFGREVVVYLQRDTINIDSETEKLMRKNMGKLVNNIIWKWFLPNIGRKKHESSRYQFSDLMRKLLDLYIHVGTLSIKNYRIREVQGLHVFGAIHKLCMEDGQETGKNCGHMVITFEKYDPIKIRTVIDYIKNNNLLNKCAVTVCEPFNLRKRRYRGFHIHIVFDLKCIRESSGVDEVKSIRRIRRELKRIGVMDILPKKAFGIISDPRKMGLYLTKFFRLDVYGGWRRVLGGIKLALSYSPQDVFIASNDLIQWSEDNIVYLKKLFRQGKK